MEQTAVGTCGLKRAIQRARLSAMLVVDTGLFYSHGLENTELLSFWAKE